MSSQWENFLRNRGEWRGTFTDVDPSGTLLSTTSSVLTLESSADDSSVLFRLRRYPPGQEDGEPLRDHRQEIRNLGRQVVFFETGCFSKGSLQVAPSTRFGAEVGFVTADRRLRMVQLFSEAGEFEGLVLIREFRSGSGAVERPPLEWNDLLGRWQGEAATVTADWPEPERQPSHCLIERNGAGTVRITSRIGAEEGILEGTPRGSMLESGGPRPGRFHLLPDGASSHVPLQVDHRQAFCLEVGWLVSPHERQRLIRRYDDRGAWVSSSHVVERREGEASP